MSEKEKMEVLEEELREKKEKIRRACDMAHFADENIARAYYEKTPSM